MNAVIYTMPDAEYRMADGVSCSSLKVLDESPARLMAVMKTPKEQTEAMALGSLTHQLILEPDRVIEYAIKPKDMTFTTKDGKLWRDSQTMPIIKQEQLDAAQAMRDAVNRHPVAKAIIAKGRSEVSVFSDYTAEYCELIRKSRIDFVPEKSNALVDIKTTLDASPSAFRREIFDRMYYMQAAYYLANWNAASGEDRSSFVFIAIENEAKQMIDGKLTHGIGIYELDADYLQIGELKWVDLINLMSRCVYRNEWPGYEEKIQVVSPPAYALKKLS